MNKIQHDPQWHTDHTKGFVMACQPVPAMCQEDALVLEHLLLLWVISKASGCKVTHHFHHKGTFGLAGEVRICERGHPKMILVLCRVHIFIYVLDFVGLYTTVFNSLTALTAAKFCLTSLADKVLVLGPHRQHDRH